jgi:hypothetical protein
MRFVRFQQKDESPRFGWLHEDKIGEIEGDLFGAYKRLKAEIPLKDARLLAPSAPSKIVCVGRNYVEHAKELGNEVPKLPLIFFKPPSSVIPSGGTILLPPQSSQVEHEAERMSPPSRRGTTSWATPSGTMSPPATCKNLTDSGRVPRASTPSVPSARGSTRTSPHPTRW